MLTVNGVRMDGVTLQRAVKLVQETPSVINMEVEFDIQGEPACHTYHDNKTLTFLNSEL